MRPSRLAPTLPLVAALLLACGGGGGGSHGPDCGALTTCGDACVDLQASKDHCGACGHSCDLSTGFPSSPTGLVCQKGQCVCPIGLVWAWMFSSYYGVVNSLLNVFGIPSIQWLGSVIWAMPAVILRSGSRSRPGGKEKGK